MTVQEFVWKFRKFGVVISNILVLSTSRVVMKKRKKKKSN